MNLLRQKEERVVLAAQENINRYQIPDVIPKLCFRSYDIRGAASDSQLSPDLAYAIGLAIGTAALEKSQKTVVVGRDARLSGPALCDGLIAGLLKTGIDVVFIGVVATPLLYFATHYLEPDSGVMVTASHNPAEDNGFKIVLAGETLSDQALQTLYQRICHQDFYVAETLGQYSESDVLDAYIHRITGDIHLLRPLKIVLDCGNGVAGMVAPRLFEALGCEVTSLYAELDGHFPNHHPDPTVPANLFDLIAKVKAVKADIGLAFDGDGDRLGVVTASGKIIWPDRQLMLFAIDVLQHFPGAPIIFDVKCSRDLGKIIADHGGQPVMWRTGHSIIKAKALASHAPLAGEMSGHLFFRDRWFGFDDGTYVGARLLEVLASQDKAVDEVFAALPDALSTPELKLPMAESDKLGFMQRFIDESEFPNAELITIDGLRIEYSDSWALVRVSNTSPCLTLRFEAAHQAALDRVKRTVVQQLLRLDSNLDVAKIL